jgi:nitrogen regulatory protein P-II 1
MEEGIMKKIECIIQPYNVETVAEALIVQGVVGMTVTEVRGFGVQKGFIRGEQVRPGEFRFHPKMKVEMVVLDEDVEAIISTICDLLRSGQFGEGKIFVSPVEDAVRTRTKQRGYEAII